MTAERIALQARWLFPVDAEPLENGIIEIERGRIAALHARHDPRAENLGNVAIIPGLVNCHTHLEFSDLDKPLEPSRTFLEWIRSLVAFRHSRPPQTAIPQGLQETSAAGTTTLGEIATTDDTADDFSAAGQRIVLFRESLGRLSGQIDEQLTIARAHLSAADGRSEANIIRGLSPHAPYSVHPDLYLKLIDLAVRSRAPVAVHLAETPDELQLLKSGNGPLVEMLRDFGVWSDDFRPLGPRPLDYLRPLAKADRALIIHGNYLSTEEIDFIAAHETISVVFCPRTHAYFGHPPHPWHDLLTSGANVALGTDSRASNPDLSLWNELRFLHQCHPKVQPRLLLELATLSGARALGLKQETGTLTPGKSADLTVISLENGFGDDPWDLLLAGKNIKAAMFAGKWLQPESAG